MELGIYSFGETDPRRANDPRVAAQRVQELIEEIELADQVGLDVFGLGEHHRPDFVVSSPAVILAAAARRTTRIRLTSAVTVLSSDDPVRVFQDFATLDLISNGRAEIMAGRGSFIESYPLFGQDLDDYDELFAEKLKLLLALRETAVISWQGVHRPSIDGRGVYPRPLKQLLPVWIAVGGTPASVMRAGALGLPLAIAIIGGAPARFQSLVQLYRDAARRAGHDPATMPVSINSHGFIADRSQDAADLAFPPYLDAMGRIGRERGWPPPTRRQFDFETSSEGALFIGSPQQVIDKMLYEHELFRHQRMLLQFSVGPMAHADIMRSIELFGTVVAPAVRAALGGGAASVAVSASAVDSSTTSTRS
jgi:probable LLM family oxidoreductase